MDLEVAIIQFFPGARNIYSDNEPSMKVETITSLLKNEFEVNMANAPPFTALQKWNVERLHSTQAEIARCLKLKGKADNTVDLMLLATVKYNRSIHSMIGRRPIDIIHSTLPMLEEEMRRRIEKAQPRRNNPSRQNRVFEEGENVMVRNNRRLGNKLTPLCVAKRIEEDLGTTVFIEGRVVHKVNIR